jgi:hypothetical protein
MRAATALITLASMVAVPALSSACITRCDLSSASQSAGCHDGAQTRIEPRVHAMNHGPMVSEVVVEPTRLLHLNSLPCRQAVCASMRPSRMMRAETPSHRTTRSSIPAASTLHSFSASQFATDSCNASSAANVHPSSTSTPLRI